MSAAEEVSAGWSLGDRGSAGGGRGGRIWDVSVAVVGGADRESGEQARATARVERVGVVRRSWRVRGRCGALCERERADWLLGLQLGGGAAAAGAAG